MNTQQAILDRPASGQTAADRRSTLKTILVHLVNYGPGDVRLETALSLARSASAHVNCLHVIPTQAYVAFDSFGGMFVMKDVMAAIDDEAAKLKSSVEAKLKLEDVSWDFEEVTGDVASAIIARAALADLVVTSRQPVLEDFVGPAVQLLGDLLFRCRTPLLIAGDDGEVFDPTGTALIAWDGSYEAANAVRASIGLLALAETVRIVQISEQKDERFPGTRLLEYLSRHGIHAELTVESAPAGYSDNGAIAAAIMAHCRAVSASCLVMGGYSHSRIGEYLFGGVTRTFLKGCPIPLLMAR